MNDDPLIRMFFFDSGLQWVSARFAMALMCKPRVRNAAKACALGQLGAMLVKLHHTFDDRRFLSATLSTEQAYASFLSRQLESSESIVLVAERDDGVVGYTYAGVEGVDYISLRGPAGVIYDLAVNDEYRSQGVGAMLLDAAVNALKARDVSLVVLSTAAANRSAQALFVRHGFRQTMIEMSMSLPSKSAS